MSASTSASSYDASLLSRWLRAANRHPSRLALLVCILAALPALVVACQAANGDLGANPLEQLIREPGKWALILVCTALSLTPLRHALAHSARWMGWSWGRRLADWNWLIRLRRSVGLASFFYAVAHVVTYVALDLDFDWRELFADIRDKPFILAGLGAFLLLLPLAVTSTDAWMRRLKRNWKRLHWLVYPAAVLAILHFAWLSKPGVLEPYSDGIVLSVLLGYRIALRCRSTDAVVNIDDEVRERASASSVSAGR
jgi:sulfoxide reductase heme-binding subunit YedZ